MDSFEREIELEEQLKELGNKLLNPPAPVEELRALLDKVEQLLIDVEQEPSRSMEDSLLPSMKALISDALFRHSDVDVKVVVLSCITEITRITAPNAPYDDEKMKEIFQLMVSAFEILSHESGRYYKKAVSILDTVATVRSCLVMLDLECDELIIEMFQIFLKTISPKHPYAVFLSMETIMTLVLDESEDISLGLISPLLASVKKENQEISPMSWKLGEKVISNCAQKIKPHLIEAVRSTGITLDKYSSIVASICKSKSNTLEHHQAHSGKHMVMSDPVCHIKVSEATNGFSEQRTINGNAETRNNVIIENHNFSNILEHQRPVNHSRTADTGGSAGPDNLVSAKAINSETDPDTVPKKRGRRPNSLMNPEEGYDHSWVRIGRKTSKKTPYRKPHEKSMVCLSSTNPDSKNLSLSLMHGKVEQPLGLLPQINEIHGSPPSSNPSLLGRSHPKRGQLKRKGRRKTENIDLGSMSAPKGEVFKTHVQEKDPELVDVSQEIEPEGCSKFGKKRQVNSVLNTLEQKTLQQSAEKVGPRNTNKGRSSIQIVTKKGTSGDDATPGKSANVASRIKKLSELAAAASRGGSLEYSHVTSIKRKRTARKEVTPELPDYGEELIGRRVKVFWPKDRTFYEGVVDSYQNSTKKHRVVYDDGDEETLNLKKELWKLTEHNDLLDGGQEDLPKPDEASRIMKLSEVATAASRGCLEHSDLPSIKGKRKQVTPEVPDYGEELIGRRVKVFWPKDRIYYKGVVDSYNRSTKRHKVLYDDGDEENLNLKSVLWKLIEDNDLRDGGQEEDLPRPNAPQNKAQKQKEKMEVQSPNIGNPRKSSERSGAKASSCKQQKARKSGGKSVVGAKLGKFSVQSGDNASKTSDSSKKSNGKLEIRINPIDSRLTTSETATREKVEIVRPVTFE